jgi:hypothetical protein
MMTASLISAVVCLSVAGGSAAPAPTLNVFESPAAAKPTGELDRIVFAKLFSLGVRPVLCSDAVFVRRVYLDVIGTLPTAGEVREFLQNPDEKHKRRELIDRLLERDEFADYWSMKWGDILRIKAEFPVNLWPNAAQAYHRWVRDSLARNKPYDQFVREMLTASGSNFRVGPVNFYRAVQNRTPDGIAAAVALTFMGSRIESWPKNRSSGMAILFSEVGYKPTNEWKEEDVFWDPFHGCAAPGNIAPGQAAINTRGPAADGTPQTAVLSADHPPRTAVFPDGTTMTLPPDRDPREVFAEWLITPKNRWFTRCIANRVWSWLLGRGIIHEPDDIRPGNPPSNPELLEYLERELVASRYDLRRLYRLILNSTSYRFSSTPRFSGPEAEANFASYPIRRLEAEVLIDAVNKVTGATDLYTSAIPEPFTYIPRGTPAIAIADGSITSPFLTLFGRSARATGMENERVNKPMPAQCLHMLNSSHIQRKIEQGPKLAAVIDSGRGEDAILEELYLTILSRLPTPDEARTIQEYRKAGVAKKGAMKQRRNDWVDIAWALVNSTEFLYRH